MIARFLFLFLLSWNLNMIPSPVQGPLPMTMCSPDHSDPALVCNCVSLDPGWCEEDSPPPNCCKRGEKVVVRCGCCGASGASAKHDGKLCLHS